MVFLFNILEIVDVFSKLDTVLSHRKREIQYLDDLIKARFVDFYIPLTLMFQDIKVNQTCVNKI